MSKVPARLVAKLLLPVCIIMVIAMWTYHPTTKSQFVWDSTGYLNIHEFWISSLSPYHIVWMFLSLEFMNWHPLTWLSWAIDYQIFGGLDPWGYHLSSNILHAINSALVFALTLVVFGLNSPESRGYPFRKDNQAIVAAVLASLFFAVHPQHVESVAWVAERKDLLCQLFLLLSLLSYVRYVTCDEVIKKRWYRSTLGLFVLALLSKPMAVTFPVVLLLVDVYPLRRVDFVPSLRQSITQLPLYNLVREKIPFFLLTAISIIITLHAQQGAMANVSLDLRVLNASNSIILYLSKLGLPLDFAPLYPYAVNVGDGLSWQDFLPILGVIGVSLASLYAWIRGHRAWLIIWLFYLVTLSPVLGLIQVGQQGAADRYAYFPTLPFYILIGAGFLLILNKANSRVKPLVWLAVIPLIILLAGKTREQIQTWENNETLWSYAIAQFPTSALAHKNLAGHYYNIHSFENAAFYFKESSRLNPNDPKAMAWHGLTALHLGQYEDALATHMRLGSALELNPGVEGNGNCIQYNISWIFAQMDMFTESSELFNRVDPNSESGLDAASWIDWLENNKDSDRDKAASEDLPGYCNKLLPSM